MDPVKQPKKSPIALLVIVPVAFVALLVALNWLIPAWVKKEEKLKAQEDYLKMMKAGRLAREKEYEGIIKRSNVPYTPSFPSRQ